MLLLLAGCDHGLVRRTRDKQSRILSAGNYFFNRGTRVAGELEGRLMMVEAETLSHPVQPLQGCYFQIITDYGALLYLSGQVQSLSGVMCGH